MILVHITESRKLLPILDVDDLYFSGHSLINQRLYEIVPVAIALNLSVPFGWTWPVHGAWWEYLDVGCEQLDVPFILRIWSLWHLLHLLHLLSLSINLMVLLSLIILLLNHHDLFWSVLLLLLIVNLLKLLLLLMLLLHNHLRLLVEILGRLRMLKGDLMVEVRRCYWNFGWFLRSWQELEWLTLI